MAIVTTLLTRSNHKKRLTEKIENGFFFHLDISFSLLFLKNPFRKHTSFGKSLAAWRNLAATRVFLSPSLV